MLHVRKTTNTCSNIVLRPILISNSQTSISNDEYDGALINPGLDPEHPINTELSDDNIIVDSDGSVEDSNININNKSPSSISVLESNEIRDDQVNDGETFLELGQTQRFSQ